MANSTKLQLNPSQNRNKRTLLFSLLFLPFLLWKCISPPDFLGGDILPDEDFSQVKLDTSFVISAYTEKIERFNTSFFSDAILGEVWDPVFGRTTAGFATQLNLLVSKVYYGENPVVDSAFIYLTLKGQMGKIPMEFAVYELTDSISSDSTYNSLSSLETMYNPQPIGQTTSVYDGTETVLKIPLNQAWVYDRLVEPTLSDSSIVQSQGNFLKHFNGLFLSPTTQLTEPGYGMYYFDYTDDRTKMAVYFTNDEVESDTVALVFGYSFREESKRFLNVKHDVTVADPELAVKFNYPAENLLQDTVFYAKGLGLARGVLVLDDLANWAEKMPIAIHRAELRLELEEVENFSQDTIMAPQLAIYSLIDDKKVALDDYIINQEVFGGKYSKSKKYYSFNITHHLQALINKDDSSPILYIEGSGATSRANGAILRSGNHSQRIKLIVTYTKL